MYWIISIQVGVAVLALLTSVLMTPDIKSDLKKNWNEEDRFINALSKAKEYTIDTPISLIQSIPLISKKLKSKTHALMLDILYIFSVSMLIALFVFIILFNTD